jgi:hypothetical protein
LAALAVLVICVGVLGWWQWNNLKSVHSALTQDQDALSQELQRVTDDQQTALERYGITATAPSQQQNDDLLSGQTSADEVKRALGLSSPEETETVKTDDQAEQNTAPQEESAAAPVQETASGPTAEELLNQCSQELYAYEIDLMAQLGQMKQAAVDQWNRLPEEEQTRQRLWEIGWDGLQRCYELETDTDSAVKAILADYREQIEAVGGDAAALDEMWDYYSQEKTAIKAYYVHLYLAKA